MPRASQLVFWGVTGLFIGSFLNVAIHRLPQEGGSVSSPRRSQCPNCKRVLTWRENIPVLSWVIQGGRCVGCKWSIPWRYPLVEILTAGLWLLAAWVTPSEQWDMLLVRLLVLSGLVVATFVDFAHFEIPDQVSIGGMLAAPILSVLVPRLHADTLVAQMFSHAPGVDRIGALIGCLAGMLVGGGALLFIGWLGKRLFGRDAMGLGDVKLLAGAGGFLGPGGVGFALVLASLFASLAGLSNMLRILLVSRARARSRAAPKSFARSLASARVAGRYIPFGPYLALGIGIVLLYWNDVRSWIRM